MIEAPPLRTRGESLPRTRTLSVMGNAVTAFAALLWVVYLVQPPSAVATGLDQSWRIGITLAVRNHLAFGRDIVFTYGPLGYVLQGTPDPALAVSSALIAVAIAAIAAAAVVMVLRGRAPAAAKFVLIVVMLVISTVSTLDYVAVAGIVALLARGSRFPRLAPAVGVLVGAVAAFGALSKYTLALDVLAAAGAVWLIDLATGPARRRRAALIAGAVAATVVALALLAAMRFSFPAAVAYARGALQITNGYSDAMALPGRHVEVALAVLVAVAVLALTVAAWREGKRTLIGLAAVTLFLAWKHGFVRQDAHVLVYFEMAPVLAAVIGVAVRRTRTVAAAFAVTALAFGTMLYEFDAQNGLLPPLASLDRLEADAAYLAAPVATQARLAAAEPAGLAPDRLPDDVRVKLGTSTVDVLPTETALIEANGLHWDPLPVFQAYSAYTPELDRMNRDALVARGASTIFYEYAAIDQRLPLGEAPAMELELACRYRAQPPGIVTIGPRLYATLRRMPDAACTSAPAGSAANPAFGTPIGVPAPASAGEMIVASFKLRPTVLSKLRTTFARGPHVFADFTYDDGSVTRFRIVVATIGDGVIVAPTPRNPGEAAAFFAARPLLGVRSITLVAEPGGAYHLDGVTFTRYRRVGGAPPAR